MDVVKRFGDNLRALRQARGLTQGELAERMAELGVPLALNLISRIEQGTRTPDLPEILALALALDVTPNRLMISATPPGAEPIELTPTTSHPAHRVWAWAVGDMPLDPDFSLRRDYRAMWAFRRENRLDDGRSDALRVREVKDRLDEATPAIEAIEKFIKDSGMPAEIVFGALQLYERSRSLVPWGPGRKRDDDAGSDS